MNSFLNKHGERVLYQGFVPDDQHVLVYACGFGKYKWAHPNIDRIVARDIVRRNHEQSSID